MAIALLDRSPKSCRRSTSVEVSPYTCLLSSLSAHAVVLTLLDVSTSHQKVALEVDFSGTLWVCAVCLVFFLRNHSLPQGYTELTVVPTSKDLKTIHLHARQCGQCCSLDIASRSRSTSDPMCSHSCGDRWVPCRRFRSLGSPRFLDRVCPRRSQPSRTEEKDLFRAPRGRRGRALNRDSRGGLSQAVWSPGSSGDHQ